MLESLDGIIPPLLTPLLDENQLDEKSLEKLVNYVIAAGVHGLFLLGTTGEGPSLSTELQVDLVRSVCRLAAERVPVLVNISHPSLSESLQLAATAADAGAAAVVATAPYYFPLDQDELWRYIQILAARSPLPLFLYNMPSHAKVAFAHETLERCLQVPRIIGIKDSSGDRAYLHALIRLSRQRSSWRIFVGPEELFVEAVRAGAQGGVLGGANLYPKLLVDLYTATAAGDERRLPRLLDRLNWFHERVLRVCPGPNGWLVGLKTAASLTGLCHEVFAPPLAPAEPAFRGRLAVNLSQLRSESEF